MCYIKVDDRECNEILLSVLKRQKGTQMQICRLPIGDFQVDNFLLVERKTIPDLIASIKDGRWFRQATKLASLPIQSLVILEGTSVDYQTLGMKRESVQGALVTLSLLFKIPMLRSKNPEETANLILYGARQMRSFGCHPGPVRPISFSKKVQTKLKRQIHVLQGLPGIGPTRARFLLEKFGTLNAVFEGFPNEWDTIPGIGKNTILQIKQVME